MLSNEDSCDATTTTTTIYTNYKAQRHHQAASEIYMQSAMCWLLCARLKVCKAAWQIGRWRRRVAANFTLLPTLALLSQFSYFLYPVILCRFSFLLTWPFDVAVDSRRVGGWSALNKVIRVSLAAYCLLSYALSIEQLEARACVCALFSAAPKMMKCCRR